MGITLQSTPARLGLSLPSNVSSSFPQVSSCGQERISSKNPCAGRLWYFALETTIPSNRTISALWSKAYTIRYRSRRPYISSSLSCYHVGLQQFSPPTQLRCTGTGSVLLCLRRSLYILWVIDTGEGGDKGVVSVSSACSSTPLASLLK